MTEIGRGGRTLPIEELLDRRSIASDHFFADQSERLARLCLELARRFQRGGRLLAVGGTPQSRSDARHVAVEFVHPVIVGKRALPALALTREGGDPAVQLDLLAAMDDVVIDFDSDQGRIALAGGRGCATIAFAASGASWELLLASDDPTIRQEIAETAYHVLWELVHVFLDHLAGSASGAGASGFLYPFLGQGSGDLDALLVDVRRSVLAKAEEIGALRMETARENSPAIEASARAILRSAASGGKVLAFGNGGSATDAMDLVADLREPPVAAWVPLPAIDLTEDPGILTALANDVGPEVLFSRQLAAHGHPGDVAVAFSTSGGSANILAALAEAHRRQIETIAFVGYDGGRIAAERLADHVIVTRSDHVPRIQEAQATAWHLIRELVATGQDASPGLRAVTRERASSP